MLDLNDLRLFERVAELRGFSAAARALGVPKSSASRGVARLEAAVGVRLLQRTTREVAPTEAGLLLLNRCADILARIGAAVDEAAGLGGAPRGVLRVSAGIGFGLNVLTDLLPAFLERYPAIDVALELGSRPVDLIAEGFDVAIRMGPLPDSGLIARRLGTVRRYLCAAPAYLARRGRPAALDDLRGHDLLEMPGLDGRPRRWALADGDGRTVAVEAASRLSVNDPVTIHRLVSNGAGIGCVPGYLCAPDVEAGRLVRLFPGWTLPPIPASAVFPGGPAPSPRVRAFVDFLKAAWTPDAPWLREPPPEA